MSGLCRSWTGPFAKRKETRVYWIQSLPLRLIVQWERYADEVTIIEMITIIVGGWFVCVCRRARQGASRVVV